VYRPFDVLRAPKAGVAVTDHWYRHGTADVLSLINELCIRNQPGVRHSEPVGGDGKAAHEADFVSGFLDESRRDGIVATWHQQNAGPIEQRSQASGDSGHVADLIVPGPSPFG
jgi:hypothetical protein